MADDMARDGSAAVACVHHARVIKPREAKPLRFSAAKGARIAAAMITLAWFAAALPSMGQTVNQTAIQPPEQSVGQPGDLPDDALRDGGAKE